MNTLEKRIQQNFHEKLGTMPDDIHPQADLKKDICLDSMDVMELLMAIEDEFGIQIPEAWLISSNG